MTYAAGAPSSLSVAEEVQARKIYSQTCAPCHTGGQDLLQVRNYRHGSDDQTVFHSIKAGFPGTSMGRCDLPEATIWSLVLYLRANRS